MKLITWNCQGAFRKKATAITPYQPDIAVIQECETIEKLRFPKDVSIPFSHLWVGSNINKGIGIFSYAGLSLDLYENYDSSIKYCIPIRVKGNHNFNLIAVWAMNHPDHRLSYIAQVFLALETYHEFIKERDTILIGDFNSNKQWDDSPRIGNHSNVVEILAARNIYSTYHEYFQEEQGEETRKTLFMYRKRERGFHIDYCFAPQKWIQKINSLYIGSYDEWCKTSDHVPLLIDFTI